MTQQQKNNFGAQDSDKQRDLSQSNNRPSNEKRNDRMPEPNLSGKSGANPKEEKYDLNHQQEGRIGQKDR